MSNELAEGMRKFREEKEKGLHFSGKSSLQSLDLLDFQKRELCSKLVHIFKACGLDEAMFLKKTNASSLVEARAAIKFRTERLTLERLAELYGAAAGKSDYTEKLRLSLVAAVRQHDGLSKVTLNEGVRNLVLTGDSSLLHLDFLVALLEKLELVSPSQTPGQKITLPL